MGNCAYHVFFLTRYTADTGYYRTITPAGSGACPPAVVGPGVSASAWALAALSARMVALGACVGYKLLEIGHRE